MCLSVIARFFRIIMVAANQLSGKRLGVFLGQIRCNRENFSFLGSKMGTADMISCFFCGKSRAVGVIFHWWDFIEMNLY